MGVAGGWVLVASTIRDKIELREKIKEKIDEIEKLRREREIEL